MMGPVRGLQVTNLTGRPGCTLSRMVERKGLGVVLALMLVCMLAQQASAASNHR
jgi:hypothetical protein